MARLLGRSLGFILALLGWSPTIHATHVLGAEVDLYFVANDQYEVRLTLWRDCYGTTMDPTHQVTYRSPCDSGAVTVTLVPGLTEESTNLCTTELPWSTCNGGTLPGIERYVYTGLVDLPPCDAWTLRWQQCCMPDAVMNMISGYLVARTTLNNAALPCRSSPRFEGALVPILCMNSVFSHDPLGLKDGPGNLRYSLVVPVDENDVPVVPYALYPGMTIDSITGRIEAPASNLIGGHMTVARAEVKDALGTLIGAVERVFMLSSIPCSNARPAVSSGAAVLLSGQAVVTSDRSLELWPGESFCIVAEYVDPNGGDDLTVDPDIAQVLPGSTYNVFGSNPATANFCWTAPLNASGVHHFKVVVTDEECEVAGVQQYLYNVRILPDTLNGCSTIGMPEANTNNALELYPNPGNALFTMRWTEGIPARFAPSATDAQGRAVPLRWERTGPNTVRLELTGEGLVYLRWSDGRNSIARSVLVLAP